MSAILKVMIFAFCIQMSKTYVFAYILLGRKFLDKNLHPMYTKQYFGFFGAWFNLPAMVVQPTPDRDRSNRADQVISKCYNVINSRDFLILNCRNWS